MPIRPENKNRYPKNWKQISQYIKERAGFKCEICGVRQYAIGKWIDNIFYHASGSAFYDQYMYTDNYKMARGVADHLNEWCDDYHKYIVIVLTTAHLDHTPENCDPSNLKALCQRCHLDYDKRQHTLNRTRNAKCQNTLDLFQTGVQQ